jgi:hypothetical protein
VTVVAGGEEIAFHQMILEMHEMAAVVLEVEERRHRVTESIASSPVVIERLA